MWAKVTQVSDVAHGPLVLKKIFSRTSRPISIKLGINRPWVKGTLNCSKGQVLFKGEIITEMQKMGWSHLKIFSPEPLSQNRSYLHESFLI
jgi:hypothetical protein